MWGRFWFTTVWLGVKEFDAIVLLRAFNGGLQISSSSRETPYKYYFMPYVGIMEDNFQTDF